MHHSRKACEGHKCGPALKKRGKVGSYFLLLTNLLILPCLINVWFMAAVLKMMRILAFQSIYRLSLDIKRQTRRRNESSGQVYNEKKGKMDRLRALSSRRL